MTELDGKNEKVEIDEIDENYEKEETAHHYEKMWRSLAKWLKFNTGYPVGGVALSHSRRTKVFSKKNELDVFFWILGFCDRHRVYDSIIPKLQKRFPNCHVHEDSCEQVINFTYMGLRADIVVLPMREFTEHVKRDEMEII